MNKIFEFHEQQWQQIKMNCCFEVEKTGRFYQAKADGRSMAWGELRGWLARHASDRFGLSLEAASDLLEDYHDRLNEEGLTAFKRQFETNGSYLDFESALGNLDALLMKDILSGDRRLIITTHGLDTIESEEFDVQDEIIASLDNYKPWLFDQTMLNAVDRAKKKTASQALFAFYAACQKTMI